MKTIKQHPLPILVLLFLLVLISSCKFTKTNNKILEFNVGIEVIDSSLKTLIQFENTNIEGKQLSVNSVITNIVNIKITNGVNLPTNDEDLRALAMKIAKQIKQYVKNESDFEKYNVIFAKVTGNSAVKTSTFTSFEFKKEILN